MEKVIGSLTNTTIGPSATSWPLAPPPWFRSAHSPLVAHALHPVRGPIRDLAALGTVVRDAAPAANKEARLGKERELRASRANAPSKPPPVRPHAGPTAYGPFIHSEKSAVERFAGFAAEKVMSHVEELITNDGAYILIYILSIAPISVRRPCFPNFYIHRCVKPRPSAPRVRVPFNPFAVKFLDWRVIGQKIRTNHSSGCI